MEKQKWFSVSLCGQLGNIGSEMSRVRHWERQGDEYSRIKALERVIELVDLMLEDGKHKTHLNEIARLREVISSLYVKDYSFEIQEEQLEEYFLHFALKERAEGNMILPKGRQDKFAS